MLNKDAKVEAKCPNCRYEISFTVRQLQSGELITCPNCHLKMNTAEAQKKLGELKKNLKDFAKRNTKIININLKL